MAVTISIVAASCSSDDERSAPARTDTTEPETTEPAASGDIVAPEWVPATRTEELAFEIATSPVGATVQHSVDAFGLLVDDFPGVTPSDLPPGDGFSGTYTLGLISSMGDELTDDQSAALESYLDEGQVVARITPDGRIEVTDPSTPSSPTGWRRPARPAFLESQIEDYSALLAEVQQLWSAHLPSYPKHTTYELSFTASATSVMDATVPGDGSDRCIIRVRPDYLASNPQPDKTRWLLAHEMFHCMQFKWAAKVAWSSHPWLFDGSAEFAAADLFRNRTMTYNNLFEDWFTAELKPLGGRQYDAWALFENARLNGYDVYSSIRAMFESPNADVAATLALGHLDGQIFRIDWSTRTLRWPDFGTPWRLDWPWSGDPASGPAYNNVFAGARGLGTYHVLGAGKFAQPQFLVTMTPDVGLVTVTPLGAPLTTRTATGSPTVADGSSRRFCFRPDGCACPGASTADAEQMDGPVMVFSFAASAQPPKAEVVAEPWDPDRQCKPEHDPVEGSSNGDPHLVSLDGLPFDVNTLGEFVTTRDPAGGFEVQTRHEPIGFGAGTTAVAIDTGDSRVTFTVGGFFSTEPAVVRVDGSEVTEPRFAAGDASVDVFADGARAVWSDGSVVELLWHLGWFVTVTVPPERAARLDGLLGSADGDLRNDLRLADGTTVDTNDAAAPESDYVLAWAVDESTSLFDYEPGQSASTFRVPHPQPDLVSVGEGTLDQCAGALGESATAHDITSCAYDVTASGEDSFVETYAELVGERERPELGTPVTFTLPATEPEQSVAPAAQASQGEPVLTLAPGEAGTVDAAAGTVLVARADTCGDAYVDIVVAKADDSSMLARAALCDPSGLPAIGIDGDDEWIDGEAYVWVPGDGAYDVGVEAQLGDPASVGAVAVYTDPSPLVVEAGALSDGDETTLQGIGDTIVYLPDPSGSWTATGLDVVCAVPVYWGDVQFPDAEPRNLGACAHTVAVEFPAMDTGIPLVVFSRADGDTVVALTPAN